MTDFGIDADFRERGSLTTRCSVVSCVLSNLMATCRWPILLSLLPVFFSLGHFAGAVQREPDTLQAGSIVAEKYELRGADGKLAATLFQGPDGAVMLTFIDQKGGSPLMIGLDAKGSPSILFFDERRKNRMALALDGGTPHVNLFDDRGDVALAFGMVKGIGPRLDVGKIGSNRISIGISRGGEPSIELMGQGNTPRISMTILDNSPFIALSDGGHGVRSTWRVMPDGAASFSLWDLERRERLVVQTDKDGKPAIRFIDPANQTVKEIKTNVR